MPIIALFFLTVLIAFWLNNATVHRILYVVFNLILLILLASAFAIESSVFAFMPWNTDEPVQQIVIIYLSIWMTAIGVFELILARKLKISKVLLILPFLGALLLGGTILFYPTGQMLTFILGSVIALILLIVLIVTFAIGFKSMFTPHQPGF